MNALLTGTVQTMSSREIAELCEKRHDNVRADIEKMSQELSLSFQEKVEASEGGRPSKVYLLPKRETLILVSGYRLDLRAKIIDRWTELEQAVQSQMLALPQTFSEALRMLADSTDKVHALEAENAELAPKAAALDLISATSGSVTITQASKLLNMKRADLTKWLHVNGWIYRQNDSWVAYREHIANKHLEYKEAKYTDANTGLEARKSYCHITQKGLTKLAKIFGAMVKGTA